MYINRILRMKTGYTSCGLKNFKWSNNNGNKYKYSTRNRTNKKIIEKNDFLKGLTDNMDVFQPRRINRENGLGNGKIFYDKNNSKMEYVGRDFKKRVEEEVDEWYKTGGGSDSKYVYDNKYESNFARKMKEELGIEKKAIEFNGVYNKNKDKNEQLDEMIEEIFPELRTIAINSDRDVEEFFSINDSNELKIDRDYRYVFDEKKEINANGLYKMKNYEGTSKHPPVWSKSFHSHLIDTDRVFRKNYFGFYYKLYGKKHPLDNEYSSKIFLEKLRKQSMESGLDQNLNLIENFNEDDYLENGDYEEISNEISDIESDDSGDSEDDEQNTDDSDFDINECDPKEIGAELENFKDYEEVKKDCENFGKYVGYDIGTVRDQIKDSYSIIDSFQGHFNYMNDVKTYDRIQDQDLHSVFDDEEQNKTYEDRLFEDIKRNWMMDRFMILSETVESVLEDESPEYLFYMKNLLLKSTIFEDEDYISEIYGENEDPVDNREKIYRYYYRYFKAIFFGEDISPLSISDSMGDTETHVELTLPDTYYTNESYLPQKDSTSSTFSLDKEDISHFFDSCIDDEELGTYTGPNALLVSQALINKKRKLLREKLASSDLDPRTIFTVICNNMFSHIFFANSFDMQRYNPPKSKEEIKEDILAIHREYQKRDIEVEIDFDNIYEEDNKEILTPPHVLRELDYLPDYHQTPVEELDLIKESIDRNIFPRYDVNFLIRHYADTLNEHELGYIIEKSLQDKARFTYRGNVKEMKSIKKKKKFHIRPAEKRKERKVTIKHYVYKNHLKQIKRIVDRELKSNQDSSEGVELEFRRRGIINE